MADRFILYHNGFYSLPNEVACCSRLSGDSLKLLGLIMNRINTAEAQGKKLKTVAMSRLLLKNIFGNSVNKTVRNYADRLKQYGFIETFSMQGGDNGEFVFTINNRPENNPYVLLCRIENDVIHHTEIQAGQSADTLLEAFKAAIAVVEHDYAIKLNNAAENERETILTEYGSYLRDSLEAVGNVYVGTRNTKLKTQKGRPLPTETTLPVNVQSWSYPEFESYFLQEYRKVTGKNHTTKSRKTGKTVRDCIKELEHHYRDHEKTERKPLMKKHINAFFVNFPPSEKITPTAFLLADSDSLYNVERYLKTGNKHIPYEERGHDNKLRRAAMQPTSKVEANQTQKGLSKEQFMKRIGATG